jgi:hypothetical protein
MANQGSYRTILYNTPNGYILEQLCDDTAEVQVLDYAALLSKIGSAEYFFK